MNLIEKFCPACTSYLTALIAFLQDINWMLVGSGVLLMTRLVHDIPPAYIKIRSWLKKKAKRKSKRH